MKTQLLLLFTLISLSCWSQPMVKFTKSNSSFMRKPGILIQTVSLTATNIVAPQNITVRRLNGQDTGVELHTNPTTHTFPAGSKSTWSVVLDVSDDTTKKDIEYHTLELTYSYQDGSGNTINKIETHVVTLKPFQDDPPAPAITRDDVLLFAGSNFDPANEGAALTSFSFESIFKVDLGQHFHLRLGGFSNRNFSVDSATTVPQTRYVSTTPDVPLKVDASRLVVQRYTLDSRSTTRSAGLYADIFLTVAGRNRKDLRISVSSHFEYVRRRIVPNITFVNIGELDTVLYTSRLEEIFKNQRITPQPTLASSENIFVPRRSIDQYYLTFGVAIEKSTKVFDLFFQPLAGAVISTLRYSHRPTLTLVNRYFTLGVKAQATIKLLDVTLAIDLKDINTSSPYTNISIGIPISGKRLTERIKEISGG